MYKGLFYNVMRPRQIQISKLHLAMKLKKNIFFENFVLHDLCVISLSLEQLHLNLELHSYTLL